MSFEGPRAAGGLASIRAAFGRPDIPPRLWIESAGGMAALGAAASAS